jgi:hypothetical protein
MNAEPGAAGGRSEGAWNLEISIEENDARTVATATLIAGRRKLQTRGTARRNPVDPRMPRVGEDLAVSRALSELAHNLISDAVSQLETATRAPAGIRDV